jgi:glyoxylase-like metal-dependent hydrolase (beta-lactamase superfamily II)
MKRMAWVVLIAGGIFGACAQPTPEQQIVNDAAEALGGAERIQAVKTLVLQGEGSNGNLGQDMTPEATGQAFKVTEYRRAIDVGAGRMRVEQTRTPNFTFFQGPQPQKQVFGVDGDVAYNVAANGNATRATSAVATDRRAEIYHHPVTIVRAALDPAAMLANPRTQNNESVVDVTTANGLKFTLATDATTKLPTRVVSMTDNTNLGDVAIETTFAEYQEVSGLQLPTQLTTKTDQWTTAELRVTSQTVDGDTGDLAAPAAAASAKPVSAPPPANVTAEKIAEGIWLLGGQSHHSVLVEFADHTKLIEAPQNDTRALAVIAKAKETVPNKPLTHLIVSHHHFDHSGGVRAAISEGLTLIVHEASAQYFRDTAGRPHTIVPDALSKKPQSAKVETVGDELEIKDATRTINLYHITGNPHSDTFLMVYFPRERLLVEADAYTPGGTYTPYAANLLENVTKRKLRVDRIIPLHGAPGPFDGLVKAAQPS